MLKLYVQNFKSIKDLELEIKPLTILVGKPDTGKSNILEAVGLLTSFVYKDYFDRYFRTIKILGLTYKYYEKFARITFQREEPELKLKLELEMLSENAAQFWLFRRFSEWCMLYVEILPNAARYVIDVSDQPPERARNLVDLLMNLHVFRFYRFYAQGTLEIDYDYIIPFPEYERLRSMESELRKIILVPPSGKNLCELTEFNDEAYELLTDLARDLGYDDVVIAHTPSGRQICLTKKEGRRIVQFPFESLADGLRNYILSMIALSTRIPEKFRRKNI